MGRHGRFVLALPFVRSGCILNGLAVIVDAGRVAGCDRRPAAVRGGRLSR
ncbi:hypothetical protein LC55x_2916 [Lysobacter capsici]|nr:hypothetical protein LC55x_2916 [Lysobacter capsici]